MASKTLTLQQSVAICDTLDKLLQPSFGPNALQTMLCTDTGKLMITSSGSAILQSLHLGHPLGRMVIRSTSTLQRLCGDGTKAFIQLLTAMLHQMETDLQPGHADGVPPDVHCMQRRIEFIKAIHSIKHTILPSVFCEFSIDCKKRVRSATEAVHICVDIIWTCLQGQLNRETRQFVVGLVGELLTNALTHQHNLTDALQVIIDEFAFTCIRSSGLPTLNSHAVDGVIIERAIDSRTEHLLPLVNVKYVLLDYEVEKSVATETQTIFRVKSSKQATTFVSLTYEKLQCVVDSFSSKDIKIVFSTEILSDMFRSLLCQRKILSAHSVPIEELEHLAFLAHVEIIRSDRDLLECCDKSIGHAHEVRSVVISGKNSVCVNFQPKTDIASMNFSRKSLVLCAPTAGICEQLTVSLGAALRAACASFCSPVLTDNLTSLHVAHQSLSTSAMCTDSGLTDATQDRVEEATIQNQNESYAWICPGGGAFEARMSLVLQKIGKQISTRDPVVSDLCNKLSKSLLSVPHRLLQNSYCTQAKKSVVHVVGLINQGSKHFHYNIGNKSFPSADSKTYDHLNFVGLDAIRGDRPLNDPKITEPLLNKVLLLCHVLDLLQQVLRIDLIVPISRCLGSETDEDEL